MPEEKKVEKTVEERLASLEEAVRELTKAIREEAELNRQVMRQCFPKKAEAPFSHK